MSTLHLYSQAGSPVPFKKSAVTVFVAALSLGLAGCNSSSSDATSEPIDTGNGEPGQNDDMPTQNDVALGENLAVSDLPHGDNANLPENLGSVDDPLVSASSAEATLSYGPDADETKTTHYVRTDGPGVYSLHLRDVQFNGFENDVGVVRFHMRSSNAENGAKRVLWADQILMNDERLSAPNTEPEHALQKVYVDENSPSYYLQLEGEVNSLSDEPAQDATAEYTIGVKGNAVPTTDPSPWHGSWNVDEVLTSPAEGESCTAQEKLFEADNLQVRTVGNDFFWGEPNGAYAWQPEFEVNEAEGTVQIDHSIERWLPINLQTEEGITLVWFKTVVSQHGSGSVSEDGSEFTMEYTQSYNLVYYDGALFCSFDRKVTGTRS